jgi:hypothetical protein
MSSWGSARDAPVNSRCAAGQSYDSVTMELVDGVAAFGSR